MEFEYSDKVERLASCWISWRTTSSRALRFADGPDEVHLQAIARLEARDQQDRLTAVMTYLEPLDTGRSGEDR